MRLRVVTYNIHKSRGLDGRVRPDRIAGVLYEVDADIIALQEVLSIEGGRSELHQAEYFASALRLHHSIGRTRMLRGGTYGNVVLSRFPICGSATYDLSIPRREPRGCLRADVDLGRGWCLHVFNVHLGTSFFERRVQAPRLVCPDVVCRDDRSGPRIVLGDFNEWTRGLVTRLLASELHGVDVVSRQPTFPGFFPVLHLDHIYYDPALELERVRVHRSRLALVASDHLPLVADFVV